MSSLDLPRDVESWWQSKTPMPSAVSDRFTRLFLDVRTSTGPYPVFLPVPPPSLPPLPHEAPLPDIEKQGLHVDCPCKKRGYTRKCIDIGGVMLVLVLVLLANIVALDVYVFSSLPAKRIDVVAPVAATNVTQFLSEDIQQCVVRYTSNSSTNSESSTYPCKSCSLLKANSSVLRSAEQQGTQHATQFCSLKSLFDSSNGQGRQALAEGGWMRDINFCKWSGITCGNSGQIVSLQLSFPAVPVSIPEELGGLTSLTSLQIVGNNHIPAHSLPSSFKDLTSLDRLHLESTAINAIHDDLFDSLTHIRTLILVRNARMGSDCPKSVYGSSLQHLAISGQKLKNPLEMLSSSKSLQSSLKFLDLSWTSMTDSIPASLSSLAALTELHLDSNKLKPPLPATFPSSLESITLLNNPEITGTVPEPLCAAHVKVCDLRLTGLKNGESGGCGVCTFA